MIRFLAMTAAVLLNCLIGGSVAALAGVSPMVGAVGLNVFATTVGNLIPSGGLGAGVYTEIWTGEMVKHLRRGLEASWLDGIPDASSVVKNDVIHLVDVGVDPDVLINNTTYPIPIQELEDGDIAISLDKFQTKVTPITDDELYAISYDKMSRVKESHGNSITDSKFAKSAHAMCAQRNTATTPVLKTTGARDAETGRIKLCMQDVINLKRALDKLQVPTAGRRLVLCSDHVNDLLETDQRFKEQYVTHGALGADQGYEMHVFRSRNPQGPYLGPDGSPAVLDYWVNNVGIGADHRGEKVVGAYGNWGFMGMGEVAQGHNSIIAAPDGRTYLVYHTRFHDNGPTHEVRVHQVYQNRSGWLCVAPFEYTGESTGDSDIATTQVASKSEIAGTYNMLIHRYDMDFANMDQVEPIKITLSTSGKITGDKTGSWSMVTGTSYLSLTFDNTTFGGVIVEQQMEPTTIKALAITACNSSGLNIWCYKMRDDYSLAYTLNRNF